MNPALKAAARTALLFVGLCLLIGMTVSALIALASDWELRLAFGVCLLLGGAVMLYAGSMMSAGGAERSAVITAITKGRTRFDHSDRGAGKSQGWGEGRSWFMLLMVAAGAILMVVGFLVID